VSRQRDISPRLIRAWRTDLFAFREAYIPYLNATVLAHRDPSAEPDLRAGVARRIPGASAALAAVRVEPAWHVFGAEIRGFQNLVFLHETAFGYSGSGSGFFPGIPSWRALLDVVESAVAEFDAWEARSRRRRLNPFYWLDRGLRAALGFPAYLISVVFAIPLSRIEESVWGRALRVATFAVDVAALVVGLHGWTGSP
jgi:hypothetical protein